MSNTITLTDEQMECLKNGESIIIEPPKKSLWEPKCGKWTINSVLGDSYISVNDEIRRLAGMSYQTEEDAYEVASHLRSTARQYAWLKEHNPTYKVDWNNKEIKYHIYFDSNDLKYKVAFADTYRSLGVIYMDENSAIKLCEALNLGEVIL